MRSKIIWVVKKIRVKTGKKVFKNIFNEINFYKKINLLIVSF